MKTNIDIKVGHLLAAIFDHAVAEDGDDDEWFAVLKALSVRLADPERLDEQFNTTAGQF
jgi:hypothetical protein